MGDGTAIPTRALILSEDFGQSLDAGQVGQALAAGLLEAGTARTLRSAGRRLGKLI